MKEKIIIYSENTAMMKAVSFILFWMLFTMPCPVFVVICTFLIFYTILLELIQRERYHTQQCSINI